MARVRQQAGLERGDLVEFEDEVADACVLVDQPGVVDASDLFGGVDALGGGGDVAEERVAVDPAGLVEVVDPAAFEVHGIGAGAGAMLDAGAATALLP